MVYSASLLRITIPLLVLAFLEISCTKDDIVYSSDGLSMFKVENPVIHDFMNDFVYDSNDYTYTHIRDYCNISTSYNKQHPFPAYVFVDNDYLSNDDVVKMVVKTYLNDVMVRVDEFDGYVSEMPIYNLIPSQEYSYTVDYMDRQNLTHRLSEGNFSTTGQFRQLLIEGVRNCRDIGGYPVGNNKRIKYGKIYRTGELYGVNKQGLVYGDITEPGINEILNNLKVKTELDIGDFPETSPISDYVELYGGGEYAMKAYDNAYQSGSSALAARVNLVIRKVVEGKLLFFHCSAGCDRTGTLAFTLEALLGVCESDLSKDYEISSFAGLGIRPRNEYWYNPDVYGGYPAMVNYIKQNFDGTTLNDKVETAMISFGVSEKDIDAFRDEMLEDLVL